MDQRLQHPAEQYMLKAAEAILMAEAYYAGLDNKNLSDNIKIAFEMTTKYSKQQLKLLHWCDTDDAWPNILRRNSDNLVLGFLDKHHSDPPKWSHFNYVPKHGAFHLSQSASRWFNPTKTIAVPSPEAVKDLLRKLLAPIGTKFVQKIGLYLVLSELRIFKIIL